MEKEIEIESDSAVEEIPEEEQSSSLGWVNNKAFYAATIAKYPRLSRAEEQAMIASLPEKEWRTRLVLHNIWFALAYADDHYKFKRDDKEEIQQRAVVGLLSAARQFKPESCPSLFRYYAINHIRSQMRDLTDPHLAGAIMYRLTDVTLDTPIGGGEDGDTMSAFESYQSHLYRDEGYAEASNLSPAIVEMEIRRAVDFLCEGLRREYARERGVQTLTPELAKDIEVFRLSCYGLNGVQIAKRYNLSKERVRQILEIMRAMTLLMYEDGNIETDEIEDVLGIAYQRYLADPQKKDTAYFDAMSAQGEQDFLREARFNQRPSIDSEKKTYVYISVSNWNKISARRGQREVKPSNWHFVSARGNFYSDLSYSLFSVGSICCPSRRSF